MSKKLIAVSAAAALALTGLVGVAPANATAASITYTAVAGSGTTASPYTAVVPHANTIVAGTNALGIVVSNLVAGDTVTVSVAGTAKVVGDGVASASSLVKVTDFGSSSLTKTVAGSATSSSFWVYDTSVAAASVVTIAVSETNGDTKANTTVTQNFRATVGIAHHVTSITVPESVPASAVREVTFKVTDVFGNERGAAGDTISNALSAVGGPTPANSGIATYDTNRKLFVASFTAAANTNPAVLTISGGANATNTGLGASTLADNIRLINSPAAAAANTALTAQVAALTAQLAASVTKVKYNKLARKWNRAFPNNRVKLAR